MPKLRVYLETARKRTFAGAVDWPGWERSGRDEAGALDSLLAAGSRYRDGLGELARDLRLPATIGDLTIVERHAGDSGTEFGVPSMGPSADGDPVNRSETDRLVGILRAGWRAFDSTAAAAAGTELRKGPRGGGRDVPKIIEHVLGAEEAYLREIGGRVPADAPLETAARMAAVREAAVAAFRDRVHGVPVEMGRRTRPFWTPRYLVRRSAWHALDHAWEIEDRSAGG